MSDKSKRDREAYPKGNRAEDNNLQTDTELFRQLQSGKTEALAMLYDRHAGLVYGIALKLLTNTAEAEDLTQDVFLGLTKNCPYDAQRGSLRTYLRILTRSRALDRLRTRARRRQKLHAQALDEDGMSPMPIEEVAQIERSQKVNQALEQLSIAEREVLRMAYYQGLSQSEISTKLGTALGTIKSRTRRGLLKLRQALADSKEQS